MAENAVLPVFRLGGLLSKSDPAKEDGCLAVVWFMMDTHWRLNFVVKSLFLYLGSIILCC
jgi:hypothetical protein